MNNGVQLANNEHNLDNGVVFYGTTVRRGNEIVFSIFIMRNRNYIRDNYLFVMIQLLAFSSEQSFNRIVQKVKGTKCT